MALRLGNGRTQTVTIGGSVVKKVPLPTSPVLPGGPSTMVMRKTGGTFLNPTRVQIPKQGGETPKLAYAIAKPILTAALGPAGGALVQAAELTDEKLTANRNRNNAIQTQTFVDEAVAADAGTFAANDTVGNVASLKQAQINQQESSFLVNGNPVAVPLQSNDYSDDPLSSSSLASQTATGTAAQTGATTPTIAATGFWAWLESLWTEFKTKV